MVGAGTDATQLSTQQQQALANQSDVLFYGPDDDHATRWGGLPVVTERAQPFYGDGFGPELSAATKLARLHPDARIAIVKLARNGTSLYRNWDPDSRGGLYDALISRVRKATKALRDRGADVRIAGFFWMQGEWDANRRAHADAYGGRLAHFIASVRADLRAPRLPVVIGRIRDIRTVSKWCPWSNVVRSEQMRVAKADPRTSVVSTDGLSIDRKSPIHFDTLGTVQLGERFVQRRFGL